MTASPPEGSETVNRRAGCGKSASPDPWGAGDWNLSRLPDNVAQQFFSCLLTRRSPAAISASRLADGVVLDHALGEAILQRSAGFEATVVKPLDLGQP
jgi:hypothetical protein